MNLLMFMCHSNHIYVYRTTSGCTLVNDHLLPCCRILSEVPVWLLSFHMSDYTFNFIHDSCIELELCWLSVGLRGPTVLVVYSLSFELSLLFPKAVAAPSVTLCKCLPSCFCSLWVCLLATDKRGGRAGGGPEWLPSLAQLPGWLRPLPGRPPSV